MDLNRYFQHSDLSLCSFLITTGKVKLLNIEWDDKNQAYFVFNNPQFCKQLRDDYYNHKALVDPFQMAITIRELKSRIYGKR